MKIVPLALLWCLVVALVAAQARTLKLEFKPSLPRTHLNELRKKQPPKVANDYNEKVLGESLAEWQLTGPVLVALPPMYRSPDLGNAAFLEAFVNDGDVILENAPFPQPRLSIDEHIGGGSADNGYRFTNRSMNAALFTRVGAHMWPLGYTTWYDVVFQRTYVDVPTPRLIAADGTTVDPTAARAIHPLNNVDIYGDTTRMEMRHLSPIVWTFPREGRLKSPAPGFFVEAIADGAEVSYMPSLPAPHGRPFGMMLLAARLPPTTAPSPRWWTVDERFRQAVVDAHSVEERRMLLGRLAADFPSHPFLDHYRVIAELGSDRFDDTWLAAQRSACALPSWYLVSWTKLPWTRVRELPCLTGLGRGALDERGEYIAESVVLAYRALRDDDQLKDLAARVVDRSYLSHEFRGFNYALSNFAWLWLKARP